jgi:hypothetical protein
VHVERDILARVFHESAPLLGFMGFRQLHGSSKGRALNTCYVRLRGLLRREATEPTSTKSFESGSDRATSIYSVIDGVLLRRLPFRDPSQLVAIWETIPEWKKITMMPPRADIFVLRIIGDAFNTRPI